MYMTDYQDGIAVFRKPSADLQYAVLGLAEEAGEVAGKFAKARRDGWDDERLASEAIKELGDVLFMVAAVCTSLDVSLADVAQQNIDKLNSRLARGTISGTGDDR